MNVCFWLLVFVWIVCLAGRNATLNFGFTLTPPAMLPIVALAGPASAEGTPSHALRPSLLKADKPTVCRLAAVGCALCALGLDLILKITYNVKNMKYEILQPS